MTHAHCNFDFIVHALKRDFVDIQKECTTASDDTQWMFLLNYPLTINGGGDTLESHRLEKSVYCDRYYVYPSYLPPSAPQVPPMDDVTFFEFIFITIATDESSDMKRLMPEKSFELADGCAFYERRVFKVREDDVFQQNIIYEYIPADEKILKLLSDYKLTHGHPHQLDKLLNFMIVTGRRMHLKRLVGRMSFDDIHSQFQKDMQTHFKWCEEEHLRLDERQFQMVLKHDRHSPKEQVKVDLTFSKCEKLVAKIKACTCEGKGREIVVAAVEMYKYVLAWEKENHKWFHPHIIDSIACILRHACKKTIFGWSSVDV